MVAGPKTIAKPLVPMVQTKNHCKTIDINRGFQTLHSLANPSLFGIFFFVEKGLASCSLISSAFNSPHLSHPKPKYKVNCDHWKNHWYQWFSVKKPLENHWYQWLTCEKKTIGKPLLPMVLGTKNHRKTIDINGDLPSIHSMAMVSIKTFYSPLLSHPKPSQCTR